MSSNSHLQTYLVNVSGVFACVAIGKNDNNNGFSPTISEEKAMRANLTITMIEKMIHTKEGKITFGLFKQLKSRQRVQRSIKKPIILDLLLEQFLVDL